jgi:hypothetical protein
MTRQTIAHFKIRSVSDGRRVGVGSYARLPRMGTRVGPHAN